MSRICPGQASPSSLPPQKNQDHLSPRTMPAASNRRSIISCSMDTAVLLLLPGKKAAAVTALNVWQLIVRLCIHAGIDEDERLIAFGEHRREDGRLAMQQILTTGVPFTGLLASNDLSLLGAMDVLRESGRRIPEDVAVIGFDDILEARSRLPPLTTVRLPTFTLGFQAVLSLLEIIHGKKSNEINTRVAIQLVIRQSCGCRPESLPVPSPAAASSFELKTIQTDLARSMAKAPPLNFSIAHGMKLRLSVWT